MSQQKSTMSQPQSPKRRPMGSPRMALALQFSLTYPDVPAYAALKIADYTDDEAQDRNRQKLLSKRRCQVDRESSKENLRGAMTRSRAWSVANPHVSSISIRSNTSTSRNSGITRSSDIFSSSHSCSCAPLTTAFISTNGATARSLSHPKQRSFADLLLLFEKYKDVVVAPLVVPEEINKPRPLPHISETALGQASTKFVTEAVLPNIKNMGREAILELRQELDNALTTNKEN
jgi:hypothetical protein